jgi:elongation factor Ts
MAEITPSMVRDLRERTGAGMMDCKKALAATAGNFEAAVDHLRKQGVKSAEKKAGRITGEGRVTSSIGPSGRVGSMAALACETDFVTSTADFEAFLGDLCKHVAEQDPAGLEQLGKQRWKGGELTVDDALKALVGRLGENTRIVGARRLENPKGFVETYIHHNHKVGVLVSVTTSAEREKVREALRDLCMHVAFNKPDGLSRTEISPEMVERERAIYLEEVKGKPPEMADKIVAGKLEKFFAGRILTEQPWIRDDKVTVQKALERALGPGTRIEAFACFVIGG